MITGEFVVMMARYNRWQNASLVAAAEGLDEDARIADRGAFFGSIMGTFSHLLWADTIWMSRFDGGAPPAGGIKESPRFETDWGRFCVARTGMDARIADWADGMDEIVGPLRWFSGALGREMERPYAVCVTHFFNHQTHHRGQIHGMLTSVGARPDDTDLFAMPGTGD
ncbi:MAG: DinB family protein [Pseudomonadota bacterium]